MREGEVGEGDSEVASGEFDAEVAWEEEGEFAVEWEEGMGWGVDAVVGGEGVDSGEGEGGLLVRWEGLEDSVGFSEGEFGVSVGWWDVHSGC